MKDLFKSIFNIFRVTGKILLGIYRFLVTAIILIFVGVIVVNLTKSEIVTIEPNTVLELTINGDLVEQRSAPTSLNQLFSPFYSKPAPETLIFDVIKAIDHASSDENISMIRLDLSNMGSAGLDNLQVLGKKIEQFRKSGKKVIIAQDNYMQMQYYLASFADTVILNPGGAVLMYGFGTYKLYFKEFLDKLSISYNVFQVGDYKSALEPFTRTSMSKEDREQSSIWLTSLWDIYTKDVNSQRGLEPDALLKYTNYTPILLRKAGGSTAQIALDSGLVDKLMHRYEVNQYILDEVGASSASQLNTVKLDKYLASLSTEETSGEVSKIGVLLAEGNIVPGKQPTGVISADILSDRIRAAAKNDSIKALVIRINSGGGSAFASELIRQELLEFKKSGKPLLISMGRLAASGAYWISADADEIWASPATITGSIGIFGAIPTFEQGLSNIGIYSDGTGTTPVASGLNLTRELPQNFRQSIQLTVEHGYQQFLNIVSKGRNIEMSKVEQIAQGRVYDGRTAQQIGLVDNLGSLEDTVDKASRLAKLDNYEPVYLQTVPSFKTQVLEFLSAKLSVVMPEDTEISEITRLIKKVTKTANKFVEMNDPQGIYAYSGTFEYK